MSDLSELGAYVSDDGRLSACREIWKARPFGDNPYPLKPSQQRYNWSADSCVRTRLGLAIEQMHRGFRK